MKFQWLFTVLIFNLAITPAVLSAEEIAVVLSRSLVPYKKACHGFSDALKDNFNSNQNTIIRYTIEGNTAPARAIMDQVARSEADLVVTIGTEATLAARDYLTDLPVVYCQVLEPVTFAKLPSAGVLLTIPAETKLGLLKQILPRAKTAGVLYDARYNAQAVNRLREQMSKQGLRLLSASVISSSEIPNVLKKFTPDQVDALLSLLDPTTSSPEAVRLQTQHCLKNKILYWAENEQAVKGGALLALTADYEAVGAQTAALVLQVLETGATLPAETPKKMLLYINEGTWKSLGLAELPALPDITVIRF
jgi:putative tryptophan/tyrosine transport system substrate-binding protein